MSITTHVASEGVEISDWGRQDALVRLSNEEVRSRAGCLWCGGPVPWPEDIRWKYIGASGVIVGPFCCEGHHWDWLNDPDAAEGP